MKKTFILAAASMAILFTQCTSKKATTGNKPVDTNTAATTPDVKKVYNDAEKMEGKLVWETSCDRCHKLYAPGDYTVKQWEGILPSMNKKSKLTPEQAGKVHAYLTTNAKAG